MTAKPTVLSGRALAQQNLAIALAYVPTNDRERKMRALNIAQIRDWLAGLDDREAAK
jgi:hypothetical protein